MKAFLGLVFLNLLAKWVAPKVFISRDIDLPSGQSLYLLKREILDLSLGDYTWSDQTRLTVQVTCKDSNQCQNLDYIFMDREYINIKDFPAKCKGFSENSKSFEIKDLDIEQNRFSESILILDNSNFCKVTEKGKHNFYHQVKDPIIKIPNYTHQISQI